MDYEGLRIDFDQWEPKEEFRTFVEGLAERLRNHAPSDAFVRLILRKSTNAVEASCKVASGAGVFMAEAVARSPVRAARKVEKQIATQLNKWKRQRFIDCNETARGGAL